MEITFGFGVHEAPKRELKGKSLIAFPNEYVVLDIETTGLDSEYNEIIEIGAIKVKDMRTIDTFQSLVKPREKIDDFIAELTGITNEMVKDAPRIEEVLPDFVKFIDNNLLVGHNVNFDINFIYDNLIRYGLPPISNDYVDTMRIARRVLEELKHHRLKDLSNYYNIDSIGNHRALKDVEITNEVLLNLKDDVIKRYSCIDDFIDALKPHRNREKIKFSDITSNTDIINEDNPFYNKSVAITGTLEKMQRKEAMQIIANLGGICQDGVNKETNFLILGNNDYNPILSGEKSSKLIKAENLKKKGQDIDIISENVFYDLLEEYDKL